MIVSCLGAGQGGEGTIGRKVNKMECVLGCEEGGEKEGDRHEEIVTVGMG